MPICLILFAHETRVAESFALPRTGNKIAAKIAMMAMTTRSSISVKPLRACRGDGCMVAPFLTLFLGLLLCRHYHQKPIFDNRLSLQMQLKKVHSRRFPFKNIH
jgi:hypothetical protein